VPTPVTWRRVLLGLLFAGGTSERGEGEKERLKNHLPKVRGIMSGGCGFLEMLARFQKISEGQVGGSLHWGVMRK